MSLQNELSFIQPMYQKKHTLITTVYTDLG